MEIVTGIFQSRADAEGAIQSLQALGVPRGRIGLLTPGETPRQVAASVRTSETEGPGMGAALGGTVGGAMGVAGGASVGAALASVLVPGVGPVIAGGLIGAALLGTGGALTGVAAGEALEEGLADGLPHDELYLYEDALRNGRSVIIAFAEDEESATAARNAMQRNNAESIDAARENWWLGLRDAEAAHYTAKGRDFAGDEVSYRHGFEAALHPNRRGKSYEQTAPALRECYNDCEDEAFRHGYERGQTHQRKLTEAKKV